MSYGFTLESARPNADEAVHLEDLHGLLEARGVSTEVAWRFVRCFVPLPPKPAKPIDAIFRRTTPRSFEEAGRHWRGPAARLKRDGVRRL